MNKRITIWCLILATVVGFGLLHKIKAQNQPGAGAGIVPIQLTTPYYSTVAISSTAAVNNATVLTIPAPAGGQYNYVCSLAVQLNNDGTGGAISNQVTTSTNFNSFAMKISNIGTANTDTGVMTLFKAEPGFGCAKSAASGTATTFTAPAGSTHIAWTWYATYYQAP